MESITGRGYRLTARRGGEGIVRLHGEVDGAEVGGWAFWHPEALRYRVTAPDVGAGAPREAEVSTVVDALHTLRDWATR